MHGFGQVRFRRFIYSHYKFSYRERIADLAVLVRLFFLGDGLDSTLADFSQGRIRTGMLAFVQQP